MLPLVIDLPGTLKSKFGRRPIVGSHGMANAEMFSDAALIKLLDNFPRENLYAFTMGTDPERVEENRLVRHDGIGGAELLQAVRNGRLWLNITRVDRASRAYRALIDRLYAALGETLPDFAPDASHGTLLISSPTAQVYYHADGPASILWHLRGQKRVWVYPALDPHYMRPELLEDIFAGVRHEYLPYKVSYDEGALIFHLSPGDWIHWPQNAPHRVVNCDSLNVSLSTEHYTPASRRRYQLYLANRFFRTQLGRDRLSLREDGPGALAKTLIQRGARRLGLHPLEFQTHRQASQRIAGDAPSGLIDLPKAPAQVQAHDA